MVATATVEVLGVTCAPATGRARAASRTSLRQEMRAFAVRHQSRKARARPAPLVVAVMLVAVAGTAVGTAAGTAAAVTCALATGRARAASRTSLRPEMRASAVRLQSRKARAPPLAAHNLHGAIVARCGLVTGYAAIASQMCTRVAPSASDAAHQSREFHGYRHAKVLVP
eukprot:SAG11_NODE_1174_length_5601_cov_51.300981_5_plen_170_part_00